MQCKSYVIYDLHCNICHAKNFFIWCDIFYDILLTFFSLCSYFVSSFLFTCKLFVCVKFFIKYLFIIYDNLLHSRRLSHTHTHTHWARERERELLYLISMLSVRLLHFSSIHKRYNEYYIGSQKTMTKLNTNNEREELTSVPIS